MEFELPSVKYCRLERSFLLRMVSHGNTASLICVEIFQRRPEILGSEMIGGISSDQTSGCGIPSVVAQMI